MVLFQVFLPIDVVLQQVVRCSELRPVKHIVRLNVMLQQKAGEQMPNLAVVWCLFKFIGENLVTETFEALCLASAQGFRVKF